MGLSIVSAIYGDWDTVKPPVPQVARSPLDVPLVDEWVMVTDNPELDAPGWHVIVEPRPHVHPCLAAKLPKFRPDLYVKPGQTHTLWIDASATVGPGLAASALSVLDHSWSSWAMFPHPHRTQLVPEVECSRTLPKYDALPLEAQVAHYLGFGYPDVALWASGAILRDHSTDDKAHVHRAFGDAWLHECVRWGFQDQLSLAFLIWANAVALTPTILGPSLFTSEHIQFGPHRTIDREVVIDADRSESLHVENPLGPPRGRNARR